MGASQRETRERLSACLAKLNGLKPGDLVREDALGSDFSFRAGHPYFTHTLDLYHHITPRDCANASMEILKIVLDHAEDALHRFEEILSFNPQGVESPAALRNSLIDEVRAAYSPAYEDVALIRRPARGQSERIGRQWSGQTALAGVIFVMLATAVVVVDHYKLYDLWLGNFGETLHKIIGGQ